MALHKSIAVPFVNLFNTGLGGAGRGWVVVEFCVGLLVAEATSPKGDATSPKDPKERTG